MDSPENKSKFENYRRCIKELLFKFLIIGDFGVGKTAIIRRYTEGQFSPYYKLTIGVDFALKSVQWNDETQVTLQLWDIAGHERFGYMTRVYYKYAIAAVIVFDLSRPATFDSVLKWHTDVREKVSLQDGKPIPILLLANKCDIPGITINNTLLHQYCRRHNILGWFFTSAKEDVNISDAMHFLVKNIIETQSQSEVPRPHVSLTDSPQLGNCLDVNSEDDMKRCSC